MKVLITGATGFLGSHLCQRLVADGHEVRVLFRRTSDPTALLGLSVERVIGDITDPQSVQLAVRDQEWVIHAAANIDYWGRDLSQQMTVNAEGTRHVARSCRLAGVRRLVHVSSVAAIGIPTNPQYPANEDFTFNLEDSRLSYHISKRRGEEAVLQEVARGLDAIIVNPASIFGPYGTRYRGAEMIQKVRRARIVPYFTGGICTVHLQDVIQGIIAALTRGVTGGRYILGGENLTYRSLVERAAQIMRLRRWFVPVTPIVTGAAMRIMEPWGRLRNQRPKITYAAHYCASRCHFYDSSKAHKALGYTPRDFNAILDECRRLGVC
jgi:dihydroflavonol-4-reductase